MPALIPIALAAAPALASAGAGAAGASAAGAATAGALASVASQALGKFVPGLTGIGGAADKLNLPQIPKFGGGAAPGFAPAPATPDLATGGGISPEATSAFTTPTGGATGPAGGGDFSAAIAQALSQILGPGGQLGSPQTSQDAFSGQFGGQ